VESRRAALAVALVLGAVLALWLTRGGVQEEPASRETAVDSPDSTPVDVPAASSSPAPTAAPAGTPDPAEARARALALLSRVIDSQAGDPANAWALAHGVLAKGPDFRASDGRRAIDVLGDDFLELLPAEGASAPQPGFARTRGEVRVEPHTDLILKTLLEAGLELEAPLGTRADAPSLGALLAASQLRFSPQRAEGKSLFVSPDDAPWTVQAWCQGAGAGGAQSWSSASGEELTLEEGSAALLGVLEQETWFIRQAMAQGQSVEKRKQGIFAYTCGGAHLFQGAAACAASGWPAQGNTPARIDVLVDLYLFRVPIETELVERSIQQYPSLAPILYNQDIKFLGHLLESLGKVERDGLWSPSPAERALLDQAETRLIYHLLQLERLGVYEPAALAELAGKEDTFQFYLDLVGDACHASAGLALQEELRQSARRP